MQVETKHWGKREIEEQQILAFPEGILAFSDLHRYALLAQEETPFFWLQSLEAPEVCFVLMDPFLIVPDYAPIIGQEILRELQAENVKQLQFYTIVVVPQNVQEMRTNLQAPILVNWTERLAKQVVLTKNDYPVRHYVFDTLQGGGDDACPDQKAQ